MGLAAAQVSGASPPPRRGGAFASVAARPIWPRTGYAIVFVACVCLFGAATPALSSYLLQLLEAGVPQPATLEGAQAIVVLAGDEHIGDGRAIPDRLGPLSLERLAFSADAYRRLRLPVAVSGGFVAGGHVPIANLMKTALERNFSVPVTWSEDRSRTTYEDAAYTAALLRRENVDTVVVVTHAWHQPRAIWSFERSGMHAVPWPVPRKSLDLDEVEDFLPDPRALAESFYAMHELIGLAYYQWA